MAQRPSSNPSGEHRRAEACPIGRTDDVVVEPAALCAYLADEPYAAELEREIGPLAGRYGNLLLRSGPAVPAVWALDCWIDPDWIRFPSVATAARALRAIGKHWVRHPWRLHRRAALIEEAVRSPHPTPQSFPPSDPELSWGAWVLVDSETILATRQCRSPFPLGRAAFVEDHAGPPSRAYRKLWECLLRIGRWPAPGERCLDLGASPGSWTWALSRLGAQVVAVDRAPLQRRIEALPGVRARQGNAFAIDPAEVGPVDWLFSDVICYPRALFELVERWLAADGFRNAICTIKLQGATDHDVLRQFAAIPGATLMHLSHNRHELTWVKLAPARGPTPISPDRAR